MNKSKNYRKYEKMIYTDNSEENILNFFDGYFTVNEIIYEGLDFQYSQERYDKDYDDYEKINVKVISQNDSETVLNSCLSLKKHSWDEFLLELEEEIIINHDSPLEEIIINYEMAITHFNFIKRLLCDDYGYELVNNECCFDEFGLEYDFTEGVKFRKMDLIKVFPDSLTIGKFNSIVNEEFLLFKKCSEDRGLLYDDMYQYFDMNQNPCTHVTFIQKV